MNVFGLSPALAPDLFGRSFSPYMSMRKTDEITEQKSPMRKVAAVPIHSTLREGYML